ncbi:Uu.00g074630.m01.CDS01 [Anthostomella pinea]|uniref:Uu.00g074630.m01.CDS01 n=1 Tax=Anthostomella pinea TaxID=933095 RepID=A0AAI8YP14_9PEZI|nr:Uu.00g074630.m01.CDS01 [Anthostomella pinea]
MNTTTTICRHCLAVSQHQTPRAFQAGRLAKPSRSTRTFFDSGPSRTSPASSTTNSVADDEPNANVTTTSTTTLAALFAKPSWSVRSLLPPWSNSNTTSSTSPTSTTTTTTPNSPTSTTTPTSTTPPPNPTTPKTLHHLLRLSALPSPPSGSPAEAQMQSNLDAQLHFVRAMQRVNTQNIRPLRAIRDETAAGVRATAVGLAQLQEALAREDVVGHARRPRRRRRQQQEVNGSSGGGRGGGKGHVVDGQGMAGEKGGDRSIINEDENWDVLGGASETAGRYFVVRSGGQTERTVPAES